MLFLQIRQAEVAVADGRLDEAYQLIQPQPLRSHRRGQALVSELVTQFLKRAKSHLAGGRAEQALLDCGKARNLAGNHADVLALAAQIESGIVEADRARRQEAKAGMITAAAAMVDSAIGREDLDRAVAELVRARGNGAEDQRLRQLDADVRSTLRSQVEASLNQGRLDQIIPLMDRLSRLDPESLATQQTGRVIDQTRQAWNEIASGDLSSALEILRRLTRQLPDAKWIKESIEQLSVAEEALDSIRTGPLGLLTMDEPERHIPSARPSTPKVNLPAETHGTQLPSRFILQVDGAGSFIIIRKPLLTLGPISSSPAPDVGLIAESGIQQVSIERIEDDYFLRTTGASSKLLANGDRISLSPRCRLTFNVPNPASTSAVLDLASGRFPRADVRRVILMDQDLVIGPGPTAHIRVDQLSESVALHFRAGQLWWRSQAIEPAKPAVVAGVSLVIAQMA